MSEQAPQPEEAILQAYGQLVRNRHPEHAAQWPLLAGWHAKVAGYRGWLIFVFRHESNGDASPAEEAGELPHKVVQVNKIGQTNREAVRRKIEKHFDLGDRDGVVMVDDQGGVAEQELYSLLEKHEQAMGLG